MQKEINVLKSEQEQIMTSSVMFARFLKDSAIALFNDSWGDYLAQLMNNVSDKTTFRSLKTILEEYTRTVSYFESDTGDSNSIIKRLTPADVRNCINELYAMKHFGKFIQKP